MKLLPKFTAFLLLFGAAANGADLTGSQVTGTLTFSGGSINYFNPANGFVPVGFSNTAGPTVTVANPAVEFGFADGANRDTADFSSSSLLITDIGSSTAGSGAFRMTFMDLSFGSFSGVILTANTFGNLTFSLVGNLLTIDAPGVAGIITRSARFDFLQGTSAVPETGSSLLLLSVGLLALSVGGRAFRCSHSQKVS